MNAHFKSATDFRRSLEARLNMIAQTTGQDLQRLRRKVAFDRLLARIFQGNSEPQFLLKGGYAMELRFDRARATRDIDLTYLEHFKQKPDLDISEEIYQVLRDVSQIDMQDFFVYRISEAQLDLANAPYGGARFTVLSLVDGRLFVRFQIDIGLDILVNKAEKVKGPDWLDFCDISTPMMSMITKEQQFAEKIHAYTLPRDSINSRVKDLIDLVLLHARGDFDCIACNEALQVIFKVRGTHQLPAKLPVPPVQWKTLFQKMAMECGIDLSLSEAYKKVDQFYQKVIGES